MKLSSLSMVQQLLLIGENVWWKVKIIIEKQMENKDVERR
jgi:hypothetical protein